MDAKLDDINFVRKIDKSQIPTCNILGVEIAAINMEWLLQYLRSHIRDLSGDYVCVANVHTTVTAFEEPEYRKIQNGGLMAIPDGGPLASVAKRRGYEQIQRLTGPELMTEIFKKSVKNGYKHYFYGSKKDTLEKMLCNLKKEYPSIEVVGMYSPPFHTLTESEDKEIVERINEAEADFVWIGLGAPKQECFMAEHQGKIKGLMIGVGAGFDYLAGNIERAPKWMQKNNLEWVYRLIQEPGRLFRRYWHTNRSFIWNAVIRKG